MKAIVRTLAITLGAALITGPVLADTSVSGYYKKDGTYVPPHRRSDPNGSKADNWSSRGNTNPYTGKEGTKDPYKPVKPKY